mmetsp:Transcript_41725/g.83876  ORF Transcript_41725/g.83876 Transcript_41725/m.83876 type:complete len:218 (+) Transcript_41725:310-963(+)
MWSSSLSAVPLLVIALILGLASHDVAAFQPTIPAFGLSPALNSFTPHRPKDAVAQCLLSLRSGATSAHREQLAPQIAAGGSEFEGSFDAAKAAGKVRIVGAVVEQDGKYLMVERLKRSRGFFEFPGGKVEDGESDMDALVRELKEELNVEGSVLSTETVSVGEDGPVQLVCYRAEISGNPSPTEQGQLTVRWVERSEMRSLAVPPADQAIIDALLAE